MKDHTRTNTTPDQSQIEPELEFIEVRRSRKKHGRFSNPEGAHPYHRTLTNRIQEIWGYLKNLFFWKKIPDDFISYEPSYKMQAKINKLVERDTLTWLGHASFLITLADHTILVDPFLSNYAGIFPPFGVRRVTRPALKPEDLPKIDIIIISHSHYDHCDQRTLKKIKNKEDILVIVPLGMKKLLRSFGFTRVFELDWHDTVKVKRVEITALPALHHSQRTPFDYNKSLWASFRIKTRHTSLFFAGDTAYGDIFEEIGKAYGPFNFGLVPIGSYSPRSRLKGVHCSPEEAIKIGEDIGAKQLVAMHWGALWLTDEPIDEPPKRFFAAGNRSQAYEQNDLLALRIGQTIRLQTEKESS